MNPKVSVVVPMFCVEQYVEKCVESLLMQTLEDIEVILVDDGSPDQSGQIAEAYAEKDRRVKVIHQKNSGLGPARNAGMKIAAGDYVGFVDSDDWVNPRMFEKLYNVAKKNDADIVASGHCDVANGKVVKIKKHPLAGQTVSSSKDIMRIRKNLYGHGISDSSVEAFPMSVCISIYRRKFLLSNNLFFENVLSEDTIFNIHAYRYASRISFTDGTDYCYRKDEQASITQTFSERKIDQFQEFLTLLCKMAEKENDAECLLRAKRTAVDYCRLYVGIVDKTNIPFAEKKRYIKLFAQKENLKVLWDGYPLELLPLQQRIFQQMVKHEWYGMALLLNCIRQSLKKAGIQ